MRLSTPLKVLIGLATAWIVVYPLLFIVGMLAFLLRIGLSPAIPETGPREFLVFFFAIFPLHCVTILIQLALLVFYIIHLLKNTAPSEVTRVILGVGMFLLPYVAMPVYYILYIWLDQPPAWAIE